MEKFYTFKFEKLNVWNNAINYVTYIYDITSKFPKEEIYGIVSQLRRAAISIPSNIAEGSARFSGKDQARFSEIAYGSLMETLTQLTIAKNLNYINQEQF